jgi:adhesin HecA-like repeat protein
MTKIPTPHSLFTLVYFLLAAISANSQTTYINNGSSTNYTLANGDSLCIRQGTYTGNINAFHENAKITVAEGATFNPSGIGNPKGKITILGKAKFNGLSPNSKFRLINRGTIEITGYTSMNGDQEWTNHYGATLNFTAGVAMNSGAKLINDGTIIAESSFTMNSGSEFNNNNLITVEGVFTSNGGDFVNEGKLESGGITFNSGTSFTNTCRLVVNGNITNNNVTITNDGLIWIPAQYGTSTITNSGTIINTANGKIKARNLTNYGTLRGSGYYYFTGATYNSGTVGITGSTTDSIRFFDATRTNASTIFDVQYGTVRSNAVFRNFPAPDTIGAYPSCGMRYMSSQVVLPVKWHSFVVNLSDNTPVLNWTSEQEAGTNFQIERSYNGSDYITLATIASVIGQSSYGYSDRYVNTDVKNVYYRIKAIEINGSSKLSETKIVRFTTPQDLTIHTSPNPFTSQFTINYQSTEKGTVAIHVYSMNGKLIAARRIAVSKGLNATTVTELASAVPGIYLVQMSANNKLIGTEKVVKQ